MRTNLLRPATVVLDTNVVVAALLWDGVPRRLLEHIASDPLLTLASSPVLLAELARVLIKAQLQERLRLSAVTPGQLVASYRVSAHQHHPPKKRIGRPRGYYRFFTSRRRARLMD